MKLKNVLGVFIGSLLVHFLVPAYAGFDSAPKSGARATLLLTCKFHSKSQGQISISWDESDAKKPVYVSESSSMSTGYGEVTKTGFSWDKELSTFNYNRATKTLTIVPKDGYKTLYAPCEEQISESE